MKVLKIILTIFFVLFFVFSISVYIFLKTFDVQRYQAQITQGLSAFLDRDVQLGGMTARFSLLKGVTLFIKDFKIADRAQFSDGYFLQIGGVNLDFDVSALITQGKIIARSIRLDALQVVFVRNSEGRWNIPLVETDLTGPAAGQPTDDRGQTTGPLGEQERQSPANAALPFLLIKSIDIRNGTLTYVDRQFPSELQLKISQVDLEVRDFSLADPFNFLLKAAWGDERQNVQAKGSAYLDIASQQVRLDDVQITAELAPSILKPLQETFPQMKAGGTVDILKGDINAKIHPMVVGAKGIVLLFAEGKLSGGKLKLSQVASPFEDIHAAFTLSEADCVINPYGFAFGGGQVSGEARVADYLKEQRFDFKMVSDGVKVEESADQKDFPIKVQGKISSRVDLTGKGLNEENLTRFLQGKGSLDLQGGKLVDFNLLRFVFSKISFIPGLVERIEQNLSEKFKEKLRKKDTDINEFRLETQIQDQQVIIHHAVMGADMFSVQAKGKMDLANNISLQAALVIPQDLSVSMIQSVPELKTLADEAGQIYIPFSAYEGKVNQLRLLPDLEYLSKKVLMDQGRQRLQDILDKALGTEEGEAQGLPAGGEETGKEKYSPGQVIIDSILDNIFKK
ncbi:MAG: AsmA family protein [Candidatus Omnitrophota bacterium]